jgi:hypothetical protein
MISNGSEVAITDSLIVLLNQSQHKLPRMISNRHSSCFHQQIFAPINIFVPFLTRSCFESPPSGCNFAGQVFLSRWEGGESLEILRVSCIFCPPSSKRNQLLVMQIQRSQLDNFLTNNPFNNQLGTTHRHRQIPSTSQIPYGISPYSTSHGHSLNIYTRKY